MISERQKRLPDFIAWVGEYLTGDEKGEAQIFLERLFLAFGHKGLKEAGAALETRVKKNDQGGTAFADLVWKPRVLIEMKKRGTDLKKVYRQAFDYWVYLVPDRPRYVVLCNFDEFWVYDFQTQLDSPLDVVALNELPDRWGALAFLYPTPERPVFRNDQQAVTRKAADHLATVFKHLIHRRVERPLAQRFILQTLVALFAEDIGLLEKYTVTRLLDDCKKPEDSYDLLGGLFEAMNTPGLTKGGRFKGVDYFNGGLFKEPARLELKDIELAHLRSASIENWARVQPDIFGTIFEQSLHETERHAFGAHFTSAEDIMKIVRPTISGPWSEAIEKARSKEDLLRLHNRMQQFQVLDPACGSGNFLYLAYREMKRLEARLFERLDALAKTVSTGQRIGFVTARNFHGMDINPFAVELAKVTMMIARKLAIDELHINEEALPLDNLDGNFHAVDALITGNFLAPGAKAGRTPWPKADVIIGNPPFLGAKLLKPERGPDYVNALRAAYPEVPGMADYCVYWIRRAHDHLPPCTPKDPLIGRAGLVGTQNIRNNQSRVGGLDHVVADGTIVEAVDNQPWSGEANVHVSIVNWVKTQDDALLPKQRRLWSKAASTSGAQAPRRRGEGPASKIFELEYCDCAEINSALSDELDVSRAATLSCNEGRCYTGQYPRQNAFMLRASEAQALLLKSPKNRDVVHPFLVGRELLSEELADRWVIDFQAMGMEDAQTYQAPFARLKQKVLPVLQERAKQEFEATGKKSGQEQNWLQTWWRHFRPRPELITKVSSQGRYIVCSRVTKRPIFVFLSSKWRPGDALSCFALADDYSFGVLQSSVHWKWFMVKSSKLKSDYRYTPESVFDTFPWPQSPKRAQIEAVAAAGQAVRAARADALKKIGGGLRGVYRELMDVPGKNALRSAHAALDAAVLAAYGFSAKKDPLAQLLSLNQAVAARIAAKQPVQGPGVPASYPDPKKLVSKDCVQPKPLT